MRTLQFNKGHNVIYGQMEPRPGFSLEATVLHDALGRFKEGDDIITSPVVSVSGNPERGCVTVKTRNTTYAFIPEALHVEGTVAVKLWTTEELAEKRKALVLGN